MVDVVTLGIALDARPVQAGVKALDDLTAAAKPAAAAASALEKAIRPATAAIEGINASGSTGIDKVTAGLKGLTAATAPAMAALKSLQAQIDKTTGVSFKQGSGDTLQRGMELDQLRAKYVPLFAAQTQYRQQLIDINSAARQGAISETERAAAITDTKVAFTQQVNSIRGASDAYDALGKSATPAAKAAAKGAQDLTNSTKLAKYELVNLSRQFQDVGVSLAGGQSPLLVAIQQGSQIADVFANSTGTVGGFFKQVLSGAASLFTPLRTIVGGIAGIGLGAVASALSWQSAQRDITIAMMGIGRASGVSAGEINKIADATSSLKGLSVSEARETATALAATGKIGVENVEKLTAQTKNFAAVLGLDVPKAAEAMAQIFANPTEGAKVLAAKIGGIDNATLKLIETLQQQGKEQEAIAVLADAVIPSIAKASEQTGVFSKSWTFVANAASNAYNAIGKALGGTNTDKTTEQLMAQRASLEGMIASTQKLAQTDTGTQKLFDLEAIKQYKVELQTVNDALDKAAAKKASGAAVATAADTIKIAPVINALVPAPELIRSTSATVDLLAKAMTDPAFESFRQKMGEALPLALDRAKGSLGAMTGVAQAADPWKSQIASLTLQNKLLDDNSPAMRRRIAEQLAFNQAAGAGPKDAAIIAKLAGAQAYGGTATDISLAQQFVSLLGAPSSAKFTTTRDDQDERNDCDRAAEMGLGACDVRRGNLHEDQRRRGVRIKSLSGRASAGRRDSVGQRKRNGIVRTRAIAMPELRPHVA